MADETIIIDADSSGLVGAVERANRKIKALRDEAKRLGKAGADASDDLARVRRELDGVEKEAAQAERKLRRMERGLKGVEATGRLMGGRVGELTGAMGDLGDLAEVARGSTVALAGGAAIAATAIAAMGVVVVDVVRNVDDYVGALDSVTREAWDDQISALYDAQRAMGEVEQAGRALAVLLAGQFTDAFVSVGDAASEFTNALTLTDDLMMSAGAAVLSLAGYESGLSEVMDEVNRELEKREILARKAREEQHEMLLALGMIVDVEKEAADEARAKAEADRIAADAARERTQAIKDQMIAQSTANATRGEDFGLLAGNRAAGDPRTGNVEAGGETDADMSRLQRQKDIAAEIVTLNQSANQQVASGWERAAQMTSVYVGQIGGMVSQLFDAQIAAAEGNDRKQRALMIKQFRAQKAVAIAQATMSTANAVIGFLSNPGGPAGIALAALGLATGIAQIAIIAAQKPRFHRGGMLPDETMTRGAITRRNERLAVITEPGRDSQAIDDINSGASARKQTREPSGNTYFVLEGRPLRARLAMAGQTVGHRR